MDRMNAVAQKRLTQVEAQALKSQKNLERTMARAGEGMVGGLSNSLKALAPTLAAAFSTQQVIKYADSYTGLQNRLKAVGLEGEALKRVEDGLYDAANRNGVAVSATAELYQRASMARENLGASDAQLMQIVSGTTAALKLQGTSAGEASGALLQLGQLLGGNMVQSQEYNSLIDGLPTVLEAVAKGSDRWGGSVNKLTQDVKAGKVSAQEFAQAMLKGFEDIEKRAGGSATTVSAALQTLDNQLGRYVGQADSGLSATARMAAGIEGLANNLDKVVPVVITLAGLVGTRYVLSLTAATSASVANAIASAAQARAQIALIAAMSGTSQAALVAGVATRTFTAALVANPIGAVLVATAALSAAIMGLAQAANTAQESVKTFDTAMSESNRVMAEAKSFTDRAASSTKAIGDKSAQAVSGVLGLCDATGKLADETFRLADAQAEAARTAILDRIAKNRVEISERANPSVWTRVGEAAGMRYTEGPNKGRYAKDVREEQIRELERQNVGLMAASIEMGLADGAKWTNRPRANIASTESDPKKPKKASGPTPEELARQRELLGLEGQIDLLKAQGRDAEAQALQMRVDTLNLTKRYEDAGVANARDAAAAQVRALSDAEARAKGREEAERQTAVWMDAAHEAQQNIAALAEDELGFRVEIARLLNDEAGVQAALREYDIARRIADLKSKGVSTPEAERQATRETDRLRGAEIVGGLGSSFQDPLEQMRAQYAEIDRLRQDDVLSEQEAAAAKAQANALYQEQRLSSASSFFGTLAELQDSSNKELAAIGKAAAIAQATMDGYVAVQKALASAPPPFNYALAAAVGVVAAANVAKIAGMADGGPVRGVGGPRQDNQLRYLSVGEYVVNAKAAKQNRALLDAMNYGGGIARMADGGVVGVPNFPNVSALSRPSSSSFSYSPTIDARGADMAAVARLERLMAEERRNLPNLIMGVVGKRAKYRLGKNAEA